jgi:prepilin-type N-terminal cleavage/methylation domain-containing protein
MKRAKGFTLIELMVVIVILGILSAVIAPRIPQFVNKAKEGRTKGNLATLRSTMNIYYSDNDGFYPILDPSTLLVPKYLKKVPECETVKTGHVKTATFNVTDGVIAVPGSGDTSDWGYVTTQTVDNWGDLWVECSHTDLNSQQWTSY